jgi:hypothetical protein
VSSDGPVDFGATGVDIAFRGTSGSGTVTVEKLDERPFAPDGIGEGTVGAVRFVVESTGTLRFTNQTEIRFDAGTLAGIDDLDAVTVFHRPTEHTGSFARLRTTRDDASNELVAQADSTGEFALVSGAAPLPIEVGLRARLTGSQTVGLTWTASSEPPEPARFQVQRRVMGPWTDLGVVARNGDTQSYRFFDPDVPLTADSVHYRLKRTGPDGSVRFTRAVTVELNPPDAVTLAAPYPNPAPRQATVGYALPDRQEVTLRLYDVLGRRVRTIVNGVAEGRHEHTLRLNDLSSGVYVLRLQANGQSRSRKLTIVD